MPSDIYLYFVYIFLPNVYCFLTGIWKLKEMQSTLKLAQKTNETIASIRIECNIQAVAATNIAGRAEQTVGVLEAALLISHSCGTASLNVAARI